MRYDSRFFEKMRQNSLASAKEIVPWIIDIFSPQSVIDVGCGTGEWLSVFFDHGVSDMLGVDGDYVDKSRLAIDSELFRSLDLSDAFNVGRKFDLAVCLEVAEHLPESAAETLIRSITRHADAVLFSAAIVGQGGTNHVNEQWPAYWVAQFRRENYLCFDIIRPWFWNCENIGFIYRQNALVFVKKDSILKDKLAILSPASSEKSIKSLVHPDLFLISRKRVDSEAGLTEFIKAFPFAFKRAVLARNPFQKPRK